MRGPITSFLLAATLAAGTAVPATAAAPATGAFKGKTSQKRTISFTVKGGKVRAFSAGLTMMCVQSGLEFNAVIPPKALTISRGRFSYRGRDKTDGTNIEIKGTISGRSASGTIKMTDSRYVATDQSFDSCVGSARWTATRR